MRDVESESTGARLAQSVACGPHRLVADEPASDGGDDRAPTPTEYLSIALASCTTMTVKLVADRHGWPLTGVLVKVSQERRPDGVVFRRVLSLRGELTDDQRLRLLDVAKRCPVSRILEAQSRMETLLA